MKKLLLSSLLLISTSSVANVVSFDTTNKDEAMFIGLLADDLERLHNPKSSNHNGCYFIRAKAIFNSNEWKELDKDYINKLSQCFYLKKAIANNTAPTYKNALAWITDNSDAIRHEYSEADYINFLAHEVTTSENDNTVEWRKKELCERLSWESTVNDDYNKEAIFNASPLCNN